jgi:hypothetical protein
VPPMLIAQLFRFFLGMIDRLAGFLLVSQVPPWLETLARFQYLWSAFIVNYSPVALVISFLDCWCLRLSVFCWMLPLLSQFLWVLLAAFENCVGSWLFGRAL